MATRKAKLILFGLVSFVTCWGGSEPEKFIRFEVPVKLKHTSFIDAFLPDTKAIIEQKSLLENLEQEKSRSDGSNLTSYEQAQRYGSSLSYSMRPRCCRRLWS